MKWDVCVLTYNLLLTFVIHERVTKLKLIVIGFYSGQNLYCLCFMFHLMCICGRLVPLPPRQHLGKGSACPLWFGVKWFFPSKVSFQRNLIVTRLQKHLKHITSYCSVRAENNISKFMMLDVNTH